MYPAYSTYSEYAPYASSYYPGSAYAPSPYPSYGMPLSPGYYGESPYSYPYYPSYYRPYRRGFLDRVANWFGYGYPYYDNRHHRRHHHHRHGHRSSGSLSSHHYHRHPKGFSNWFGGSPYWPWGLGSGGCCGGREMQFMNYYGEEVDAYGNPIYTV